MKASANCLALVKHYERFMPNPYLCPAGVATIGYGTTVYDNGKKVRLSDQPVTEPEACDLLAHDILKFESDVNTLLKVTVSQSMFDGLVSFAYNVGSGIGDGIVKGGLAESTLLKLINANIMATAADWKRELTTSFLMWNKARVNGVLKPLGGLTARRTSEAFLATDGIVKFFTSK
jgi:lysozyme